VARVRKHDLMVFVRQVWSEKRDGGERERAIRQELEHHGESRRGARGFDPSVGRVLGQAEHLRAVGEERRAAFTQIQAPEIDLSQQSNEPCGRATFYAGRCLDFNEQFAVGESRRGND
jgi:hypothetical protein